MKSWFSPSFLNSAITENIKTWIPSGGPCIQNRDFLPVLHRTLEDKTTQWSIDNEIRIVKLYNLEISLACFFGYIRAHSTGQKVARSGLIARSNVSKPFNYLNDCIWPVIQYLSWKIFKPHACMINNSNCSLYISDIFQCLHVYYSRSSDILYM